MLKTTLSLFESYTFPAIIYTATNCSLEISRRLGKSMVAENKDKLVVVKHNELIRAAYRLTVMESRILLTCIAQIDSRKSLSPQNMFNVHISDLEGIMEEGRVLDYTDLKQAALRLADRWVYFLTPNERFTETFVRWICSISYLEQEGTVRLGFSPGIIPMLSELTANFTQYKLENVINFKSAYTFRLYEILKSWMNCRQTLSLEFLHEVLQLSDSYGKISNLRDRVLQPSIDEINAFSDINVTYEAKKLGRSIVGFTFTVSEVAVLTLKPKKVAKTIIQGEVVQKKTPAANTDGVPEALKQWANMRKNYGDQVKVPEEIELQLREYGMW